ncbi:unnamed protein product [Ectocarpus sp. 4 AP-2014]
MCLQVLFLGPALPSTFGVVSEKLVVSPVLRTLTLKRVQPYVKEFASEVCRDWPDIRGFLACHYSRRVPATTQDFRRAFGFAFANVDGGKKGSSPATGSGPAGEKKQAFGDAGGFLKSLGLDRLLKAGGRGGVGDGDNADPLDKVPEQDLATLNFVNDFVVKYGLADEE